MGSGGVGSAATSLLKSAANTTQDSSGNYYATTNSNGGFSISGDYTCLSADSQVYIVYAFDFDSGERQCFHQHFGESQRDRCWGKSDELGHARHY